MNNSDRAPPQTDSDHLAKPTEKTKSREDQEEQASEGAAFRWPTDQELYARRYTKNDWLIHDGDMNYCRRRGLFQSYNELRGVRIFQETFGWVTVAGIGDVRLRVQRSPGKDTTYVTALQDCLHIPEADCNGISMVRMSQSGRGYIDQLPGRRIKNSFLIGRAMWSKNTICGSDASGCRRLHLPGECQTSSAARPHPLAGKNIDVSVELDCISALDEVK
jgi:hypothetical protein